jgi:Tfp pilus assembly protein FimT
MPYPNRRAVRSDNRESGVSLIESVIAFLVIAIVLAFALPALSRSIKAYNLRSAANHMAQKITAVRSLAMSKNKNVTFSFNNSSGLYGFDFTGTDGDGVPDTTDPEDPVTSYNPQSLPSEITATFPGSQPIKVTFNSRGELPIGGSEASIVLTSYDKTVTVKVNLRGKVSVE